MQRVKELLRPTVLQFVTSRASNPFRSLVLTRGGQHRQATITTMDKPSKIELQTFRNLAKVRPLRKVQAGEVIFRSGDRGDCLFCVVDGQVKMEWDDARLSETIEPGCSFGVGALVDPQHHRFGTATALSDGELLEMDREEFLLAIQELPMFALEMLHDLDERLRDLKTRTAAEVRDGIDG
jgi:CRP/FNR family cyclic AMP-dependent transcriptional regulator